MLTRINFPVVSMPGRKIGKCACGKRRVRSVKIEHTVNPFNINADGIPKSREEVYDDVKKEFEEWYKEPIYCKDCEPVEVE